MGLQNTFKNSFARELMKDFETKSVNQYYLYFGKSDAWSDENSPDAVTDSVASSFSAYRNAVAFKRIDRVDGFHIITRYDWVSGTVYDQYDDTADMSTKKYYVMTDEYNLYKCISNSNSVKSTTKPTHTEPEIKVVGGDGYKWKFLGKVTESARKFLTDEYIPIEYVVNAQEDENSTQLLSQQQAVDGAIDRIILNTNSAVYSLSSSPTESTSVQGKVLGSSGITTESSDGANDGTQIYAGLTVGFLYSDVPDKEAIDETAVQGYRIYTNDGAGDDIGQIRTISRLVAPADQIDGTEDGATGEAYGKGPIPYFIVDRKFDRTISSTKGTKFKILPPVQIYGDGASAEARTKVNADKRVSEVTILNRGRNYTTASVLFPKAPDEGAKPTATTVIGPRGGHGSNPVQELESTKVMLVLSVLRDESGKLRTSNQFRQFGIIRNPKLNDGTDRLAGTENFKKTQFQLSKPFGVTAGYKYLDNGTYKKDNYILGQESFATARITGFRPVSGATSNGILEITQVEGEFDTGDTSKKLIRFIFGRNGGTRLAGDEDTGAVGRGVTIGAGGTTDFQVGEVVTQFTAPYDESDSLLNISDNQGATLGTTAEGVVKSWDNSNRELIVEVIKNAFTDSSTAGYVRGDTACYICFNNPRNGDGRFENKGGELLKQVSLASTADSVYGGAIGVVTFGGPDEAGGTAWDLQNYGRILGESLVTDSNSNPVYKNYMTLQLEKTDPSTSFSTTDYTEDQLLYQGDGSDIVSGRILEWFTFEGTTGELHLTEIKGNYNSDEGEGWTSGMGLRSVLSSEGSGIDSEDINISSLTNPEILHGSGEVLYIQNIRPVSRSVEQDEEFKVVIGF